MKKLKTHINSWMPVFLWMGIIYLLSATPNLGINYKWGFFLRKLAHIIEYFILVILLWRALKITFSWDKIKTYLWSGTLSLFFAVSDELHQHYVATRCPSVTDVLIDTTGIMLALIIIHTLFKTKEN
jgi:VanZ family protein